MFHYKAESMPTNSGLLEVDELRRSLCEIPREVFGLLSSRREDDHRESARLSKMIDRLVEWTRHENRLQGAPEVDADETEKTKRSIVSFFRCLLPKVTIEGLTFQRDDSRVQHILVSNLDTACVSLLLPIRFMAHFDRSYTDQLSPCPSLGSVPRRSLQTGMNHISSRTVPSGVSADSDQLHRS